jgi:DNA-binding response OmpR family regulator
MGSRVLVLEDDTVLARHLRRLLEREGYRVSVAGCVAEFVELASRETFDRILLDRSLPDGDGIEAWSAVRGCQWQARAVVMTALDGADVSRRANDLGIVAVFPKPVDLRELLRRLGTDEETPSTWAVAAAQTL